MRPEFADGKQAFKDGVSGFLKAYPDSTAVIKHIGADGDLVFIHNHIKLNKEDRGQAAVDIFRIKDGKIVGKGHNRVLIKHDPTCHAEIEAIRDACQNLNTHDLTGCTLYTSCYPCPMCLSAIIWANIKKVYYGNTAKNWAEEFVDEHYTDEWIENRYRNMKLVREPEKNVDDAA